MIGVIVGLSSGGKITIKKTLEEFEKEHLDEQGNFKTKFIGFIDENGKRNQIVTSQIVAIQEQ